jgi:hypothetical protein
LDDLHALALLWSAQRGARVAKKSGAFAPIAAIDAKGLPMKITA